MKFSKAFKSLNPAPLFRGSCFRKQDCIANEEEVALPKRPANSVEASNSKLTRYIVSCAMWLRGSAGLS